MGLEAAAQLCAVMLITDCSRGLGQLKEISSSPRKSKGFQEGEIRETGKPKRRRSESGLAGSCNSRPGSLGVWEETQVLQDWEQH